MIEPLLISKATLCKMLSVSVTTLHRRYYHFAGFPKPVMKHGNVRLWRLSDVQEWVKNLKPEE